MIKIKLDTQMQNNIRSDMYSTNLNKSNKFDVLDDAKNKIIIPYDENGNIDLYALIPEYKVLMDAMKNGLSWYDIIYPNGERNKITDSSSEKTDINEWNIINKKRKRTSPPPSQSSSKKQRNM